MPTTPMPTGPNDLDEILNLLIDIATGPDVVQGPNPSPLLFGLTPTELLVTPLWVADPVASVRAFRAPDHWIGMGVVAPSTAHLQHESFDITLAVVVNRSGEVATRLVSTAELGDTFSFAPIPETSGRRLTGSGYGEGELVDAFRVALGTMPSNASFRPPGKTARGRRPGRC